MLRKYSAIFASLMLRIQDQEMALYRPILDKDDAKEAESECLSADVLDNFSKILISAKKLSDELSMDSVLPLIDRMAGKMKVGSEYLVSDAYRNLGDLKSRIYDTLHQRYFFYLPPASEYYFSTAQLFGPVVEQRFTKVIGDIEDAGKCLAFGRGTSCVMHLMRVMEEGLKQFAKSLGIPYAYSWESYLNQIQARISAKSKTKGIKWKRDEKTYRDLSGDLMTVKQAWRNPTMHIDRRYSPEEAEEIFRAVRTFMQHLAEKLPTSTLRSSQS